MPITNAEPTLELTFNTCRVLFVEINKKKRKGIDCTLHLALRKISEQFILSSLVTHGATEGANIYNIIGYKTMCFNLVSLLIVYYLHKFVTKL